MAGEKRACCVFCGKAILLPEDAPLFPVPHLEMKSLCCEKSQYVPVYRTDKNNCCHTASALRLVFFPGNADFLSHAMGISSDFTVVVRGRERREQCEASKS